MEKQIKTLKGYGLDSDSNINVINGARYISNFGFTKGNYDALVPRKIPELISHVLPSGSNRVIGYKEDKENRAVFYMVYNSNNNHGIYRVYADKSIETIISNESNLGFDEDFLIYPCNISLIGDGDDLELSWTDRNNKPMAINVNNHINGLYATIDESVLYRERPSPTKKPIISIVNDDDYTTNNIDGRLFQFAYTYVYANKQESAFSHWSDASFNYLSDNVIVKNNTDISLANCIQLTMYVDWDNVTSLNIYYRILDEGDGAPGYWYYYDNIDSSTPYVTYDFYNDKIGVAIDDTTANTLYDDIPNKAESQSIVEGNRIVYGGITKGVDAIDIDVGMVGVYKQHTVLTHFLIDSGSIANGANNDFDFLVFNERNVSYRIYIHCDSDGTQETHTLLDDSDINPELTSGSYKGTEGVIDYYVTLINNDTTHSITASKIDSDTLRLSNASGANIYVYIYSYYAREKAQTLGDGAKHSFAIRYYDKFDKSGYCQDTEVMNLSISKDYSVLSSSLVRDNMIRGAQYTINHLPPSDAVCYQWLYGGSNILNRFTLPIFIDTDLTSSNGTVIINYTQALNRYLSYMGEDADPGIFELRPGDSIRIKSYFDNTGGSQENYLIEGELEVKIIDVDISTNNITIPELEGLSEISGWASHTVYAYMFEFIHYSDTNESNTGFFYEIGDVLPIVDIGGIKYHTASGDADALISPGSYVTIQNQTNTQPAIGNIPWGDMYLIPQCSEASSFNASAPHHLVGHIKSYNASLFYSSYSSGLGRYGVIDNDQEVKYLNALVYSGTFSNDDLNYNQLNKFYNEVVFVNDVHGKIQALVEMGYSLYVYQRSKITPIEIGRSTVEQDGQQMVVSTNVVLGSQRPLSHDIGTTHPGSIVIINDALYWFDPLTISVFKLSQAGIDDISTVYMKNHYQGITKSIFNDVDRYNSVGVYDPITESYVLMFKYDNNIISSKSFHLPTKRWVTNENYKEDGAVSIGNEVFSFSNGYVYSHHEDTQDYDNAYVDIHFTPTPYHHVLFNGIEIDSKYLLTTTEMPSIWVDPDDVLWQDPESYQKYNGNMQSIIPDSRYKRINGKYKASFLRNILNTDGSNNGWIGLYNGDVLAGNSIVLRLTHPSSSEGNELRSVSLLFTKRN